VNRNNLENLVRIGQLKSERSSRAEIEGLVRSGRRRLQDAENEALNLERYSIRLIARGTWPSTKGT
jgi:hypothetical protein